MATDLNDITDFLYYRGDLLLQQSWEFVKGIRKLWWGGLFLITYLLLVHWYKAVPIFLLTDRQYSNGILTLSMLAWMFLLWSHVLHRQTYTVTYKHDGNGQPIDESVHGNNNWVGAAYAMIVTVIFAILRTPVLGIVIIGALQAVPFFSRGYYEEQGEYEVPRLANFSLLLLAAWLIAFRGGG